MRERWSAQVSKAKGTSPKRGKHPLPRHRTPIHQYGPTLMLSLPQLRVRVTPFDSLIRSGVEAKGHWFICIMHWNRPLAGAQYMPLVLQVVAP